MYLSPAPSKDVEIFTNNLIALGQNLNRDVSKASAIDFVNGRSPIANVGLEETLQDCDRFRLYFPGYPELAMTSAVSFLSIKLRSSCCT